MALYANTARKTRHTAEHDQPAVTEVEGKIRELVHALDDGQIGRDVETNLRRQPENESERVATDITSVLQRVSAASVQEIDRLITELQALSDMLHREATRVQREVVQYSTLTQAALQSTKIIAESLTQLKNIPDASTLSN